MRRECGKHGPRHLGEEVFDKIEPGTMFRGKHKGKAALWLGGKPGSGFLGDVGGVVVEDQLDGGICRVSSVEFLQKADKPAPASELRGALPPSLTALAAAHSRRRTSYSQLCGVGVAGGFQPTPARAWFPSREPPRG
jgi:hypothetical protein